MKVAVVVLAGGDSLRFGRDKLAPDVGVLQELLASLSPRYVRVLVGPEHRVEAGSGIHVTREEPAGGGPAAALVAGARLAHELAPDAPLVVLPGDAPGGARLVQPLVSGLSDGRWAACPAVGDAMSPLPVALSPGGVQRVIAVPGAGHGESVRRLVAGLRPVPLAMDGADLLDVDTPDDLRTWRTRTSAGPASLG